MNSLSTKFTVFAVCAVVLSFGFLGTTSVAYANGEFETGWYDTFESYDAGWDTGWYDSYESYTPDTGWYDTYESYGAETGWYDTYESYSPETGWYDTYESYSPETGWYDTYESYSPEWDSACGCYDYGYDYDVTDEYYYDSYGSSGYSSGSKGFSFPSFSSSGFSYAKPMTFGSPSYPVYTPPAKATGGNSSVSNVTNTTITNVDNSINDSFNNYQSGNVYVAPLSYATPQYPVVYTQPAPYCQIYQASSASGYGVNSSYLSWTSSNASSAYLSNVGSVNVNGSTTVWPTHSTTYTLTVYGSNGQSAQCSTTVQAYSTPYVSLTQIPYTGFDFGTFGNAMYWAGLAVFALGAGYLAVYYLPRTVLGKAGIPAVSFAGVRTRKFAPVIAEKAPILVEKEAAEVKVAPIVNAIRKAGTLDSMAIVDRKDGSMPKIVISRE